MEESIKRLARGGIDAEGLSLNAPSAGDPEESSRERLKIAERYIEECTEYIEKGDAVQASEKAYKAAEEVIKALAEKYRTPEYGRFLKEGRWYTYLLSMASKTLAKNLGDWIQDGWNAAYDLHVWGFHEGKLTIEYVKVGVEKIKKMLNEAKIALQQNR